MIIPFASGNNENCDPIVGETVSQLFVLDKQSQRHVAKGHVRRLKTFDFLLHNS